MASLKRRLVFAASSALVVTLSLSGVVLDNAFRNTSQALAEERLQAYVYATLAAAEEDIDGKLVIIDAPADPQLATPDSGLYARLVDSDGRELWTSPSTLGKSLDLPAGGPAGVLRFRAGSEGGPGTRGNADDGKALALNAVSMAIIWEHTSGQQREYTVQVAEHRGPYQQRLRAFRGSLLLWFSAAAVITLLVQAAVLGWGLAPLRRAADELADVRAGRRARIDGQFTDELQPLTDSINRLIDSSEQRLKRYRDALGNLAHTLKTPLAVMRSAQHDDVQTLRRTIDAQVERMDRAVAYHLKRAAASGQMALGPTVVVHELINSLLSAMSKVYADRTLTLTNNVATNVRFHGDEGDLMEVLGNLVDNACKWAKTEVTVLAQLEAGATIVIDVTDDGPGIPLDQAQELLQRGARADPDTPGHGIGLAVVQQLVCEVYGGTLEFLPRDNAAGLNARITLQGHPGME
jgi:two-component system, OmpR family, sensor histidine kinase PhoQ